MLRRLIDGNGGASAGQELILVSLTDPLFCEGGMRRRERGQLDASDHVQEVH